MKRPPYAHQFIERRGKNSCWWLLLGTDAWETGKRWESLHLRPFVVCPPNADPGLFDWSLFRDAPDPVGLVRCGEVDGVQLRALLGAVLAAGAPPIYDLFEDVRYAAEVS